MGCRAIGVEGESLEDLLTQSDPKFWAMIERVRQQPTISLEEARKHFQQADAFEASEGRPMSKAEAEKALSPKRRSSRGSPRKR